MKLMFLDDIFKAILDERKGSLQIFAQVTIVRNMLLEKNRH